MRYPHSSRQPSSRTLLARRRRRVLRKNPIIPRICRITPLDDALNRALAGPDATDADGELDNDLHPSDSPREVSEGCLEDAVNLPQYDEGTSESEVEALPSTTPSSSSSPVYLPGPSPRTDADDAALLPDESLEDPMRPPSSLYHHPPRHFVMRGGGAASAPARDEEVVVVKDEEDQDDEMPPSSPVAAERSLEPAATPPWWYQEKKASITFYRKEIDEKMYTIFDYEVDSDPQRYEGDISRLSIANSFPFEGVTNLMLSFHCPGPLGEEGDKYQERRRSIIEALCRLGAILGGGLRGLEVTAPWPELSFPFFPDILGVILDSFPALGNLRFGDLQCGCCDCESVYMDTVKFRRLQVAALEGQVFGPLTAAMLQTVMIERKSLHLMGRDFMKYIGDTERHLDEPLFGTWTVTKGEDSATASMRAQQEAQFLVKLLKWSLPSALHFRVVSPELQVLYEAPSPLVDSVSADSVHSSKSPTVDSERDTPVTPTQASCGPGTPSHREGKFASKCTYSASEYTPPPVMGVATSVDDPSVDLSGDISLEDEVVPHDPTQEMEHVDESPRCDAFTESYEGLPPDVQPRDACDADPVQGVIFASECDWWSEFRRTYYDGLGVCAESADINTGVMPVPPLASELFGASTFSRAGSLFSGGSESSSAGILDDVRQHCNGDVDCDQLVHVPLDSYGTTDISFSELSPDGRLEDDNSTILMPEPFFLGGQVYTCFNDVDMTAFTVAPDVDNPRLSVDVECPPTPPACGFPDSEAFSYGLGHWYDVDQGLSQVTLGESEDGEPGSVGVERDMNMP